MRRSKRLNTRGKMLVSVLFIIMIILLSGLVSNDEKKVAKGNDANRGNVLEMVSFSFEPVAAFADSPLSQSIIEKENEKREAARQKEYAEQNKIDKQDNVIYLTFDDGPSYVSGQLMDILDDYQMKATFFMMGPKMKEYPKAVKRMEKEGHGLALHGMTHDAGKIYSDQSAPSAEMIEGQKILESITGVHTNIVRLPYGSIPYLTEGMRYVLSQNDFTVWDWNVDSLDWKFKNKRYVQHTIQEIQKMERLGEAPIVLLHDKQETVNYLPELLSYIKKQGYKAKVLTNDMSPLTFSCEGRCHSVN